MDQGGEQGGFRAHDGEETVDAMRGLEQAAVAQGFVEIVGEANFAGTYARRGELCLIDGDAGIAAAVGLQQGAPQRGFGLRLQLGEQQGEIVHAVGRRCRFAYGVTVDDV